jgi:hypothetical protein
MPYGASSAARRGPHARRSEEGASRVEQPHQLEVVRRGSVRSFDPYAALVLWQIGLVGQADFRQRFSTTGLALLMEVLTGAYGPEHQAVLYEAAVRTDRSPSIRSVHLARIPEAQVGTSTTLYVPPLRRADAYREMAVRLFRLLGTDGTPSHDGGRDDPAARVPDADRSGPCPAIQGGGF